jgi:Icc-related predicted phosphoesterase
MDEPKKPKSSFGLLEICILIFIVGFVFCFVIQTQTRRPRWRNSPANACINNLRQIDAGANQFALENHKTNGEAINFPDDLTPYVKLTSANMPDALILEAAVKCQCRQILAVKGNHDTSAPFPAPIRDLHLNTFTFNGVKFGGFNGAWRYKPRGNFLWDHDEVESLIADFPPVDVFLAHNSPRGIHDRDDEVHIGFVAFTNYLTSAKPGFFIHGHMHHEIDTVVGTTRIIGVFGYRFLTLPVD